MCTVCFKTNNKKYLPGLEGKDYLYNISENVNWYSHYEKDYKRCSKNKSRTAIKYLVLVLLNIHLKKPKSIA